MTGDGGAAYHKRLVRDIKHVLSRYEEQEREARQNAFEERGHPAPPGGRAVPWFLKELWRQTGR